MKDRSSLFNPAMLKNYFKTATRNLSKNKFFTTLNVFGLALGMSLDLLYVAMVLFIFQFDNFHSNREYIYRVYWGSTLSVPTHSHGKV